MMTLSAIATTLTRQYDEEESLLINEYTLDVTVLNGGEEVFAGSWNSRNYPKTLVLASLWAQEMGLSEGEIVLLALAADDIQDAPTVTDDQALVVRSWPRYEGFKRFMNNNS